LINVDFPVEPIDLKIIHCYSSYDGCKQNGDNQNFTSH